MRTISESDLASLSPGRSAGSDRHKATQLADPGLRPAHSPLLLSLSSN